MSVERPDNEAPTAVLIPEDSLPKVEESPRPSWVRTFARDLVKASMMTLILFLLMITFIVQGFKVYGSCMEPNLNTGERLLGNKFIYRFEKPSRGDVIVFRYPKDPKRIYIKRVIALPGERLSIRSGSVYINGKKLTEPYVRYIPHGDYTETRISEDCLFVMGDFRDVSNDSRYWGELPLRNVQAKVWVKYWPVRRAEMVN